jgi:hypothetical protein
MEASKTGQASGWRHPALYTRQSEVVRKSRILKGVLENKGFFSRHSMLQLNIHSVITRHSICYNLITGVIRRHIKC